MSNSPKTQGTLTLYPEQCGICRLDPGIPIPTWATNNQASFFSVTRSEDELSIICPQEQIPDGTVAVSTVANTGWHCFRLSRNSKLANAILIEPLLLDCCIVDPEQDI